MNKVQRWEILGTIFIIGFGTTLHFWFEWTGYWRPMALIAAVNESTWEHFKMAFWPGLLFALIEYPFLKEETNNFFVAKFAGLLVMPVITVILFYGYTSLTGTHLLWVDVIIFILSVIGGQWTQPDPTYKEPKNSPQYSEFCYCWIGHYGAGIFTAELLSAQELFIFPPWDRRIWHLE